MPPNCTHLTGAASSESGWSWGAVQSLVDPSAKRLYLSPRLSPGHPLQGPLSSLAGDLLVRARPGRPDLRMEPPPLAKPAPRPPKHTASACVTQLWPRRQPLPRRRP